MLLLHQIMKEFQFSRFDGMSACDGQTDRISVPILRSAWLGCAV